jgi:hypothetical protein
MGCNCKKTSIKAPEPVKQVVISEPVIDEFNNIDEFFFPDTKEGRLAKELDVLNAEYFKQYEEDKKKQNG